MRLIMAMAAVTTLCGSAHAAVYDFTAGTSYGTITTSNTQRDPGYFEVNNVTFTKFLTGGGPRLSNPTVVATDFYGSPSFFNPQSKQFEYYDYYANSTQSGFGPLDASNSTDDLYVYQFENGAVVRGINQDGNILTTTGSLNINVPVQVSAAPEPAAWALMIMGAGIAGGALRRRKAGVRVSYAA